MAGLNEIPLRVVPVKAGGFIVAGVRTGLTMGLTGRIGDGPAKVFETSEQAIKWCLALPQPVRKYVFENHEGQQS